MTGKRSIRDHQVSTFEKGQVTHRIDPVTVEEPLEIRLLREPSEGDLTPKRMSLAITMRTPGDDKELALGFLFSEGIIRSNSDVLGASPSKEEPEAARGNVMDIVLASHVSLDEKTLHRHTYINSSCGVCGKTSIDQLRQDGIKPPLGTEPIRSTWLHELPSKLEQEQQHFKSTGGLHAAAVLSESGDIQLLREDVGRHNAMDKVLGALLQSDELPLSHRGVLFSGRTSFELIQKAIMGGFPLIASVGAPSSLAIELATEFGVTLVGFLSASRFNVYSGAERIS
ncbi:MAG: formate dehydrogenase accessory sulfurtransferase FdhD [Candidatus Eisenbacteria bacterium]|uniref:Sulfur carrier protein FdhD n=1 Tax=Eiseniibacteriota bacterium TaxID=2212470 RepID=A0A7Y2H2Y5_UNCEI|nr:formate dehydrogenase accessory sulfurtransferase FdhD [Candidatus Eisenbacteria bacterium]